MTQNEERCDGEARFSYEPGFFSGSGKPYFDATCWLVSTDATSTDARLSAWSPHLRVNVSVAELSIKSGLTRVQANRTPAADLGFHVVSIPEHRVNIALTVAWNEEGYNALVANRGEQRHYWLGCHAQRW